MIPVLRIPLETLHLLLCFPAVLLLFFSPAVRPHAPKTSRTFRFEVALVHFPMRSSPKMIDSHNRFLFLQVLVQESCKINVIPCGSIAPSRPNCTVPPVKMRYADSAKLPQKFSTCASCQHPLSQPESEESEPPRMRNHVQRGREGAMSQQQAVGGGREGGEQETGRTDRLEKRKEGGAE